MTDPLEIAVVGAGPCGLAVGVAAREADLPCALFDRSCLVSAIARYPIHMTFFSTADRLEIGGRPFAVAGERPSRREALEYYRRVARHFRLRIHQYEEVVGVEGERGDFRLRARSRRDGRREYRARHVVFATGYFDNPNLLGVPGEDLPKVTHYYREAHPYYDRECLVVGGGNSAVEAALDLHRTGARVTLVHFRDGPDPGVKPWVLPELRDRLRSGEIAVHWRTRVREIRPGSVVLVPEDRGETFELPNDWVFAMTGYHPDPSLLEGLGVPVDPESGAPEHDPDTMETPVPGVFVAGVLAAGKDANRIFIENGREHGPRIVAAVLRRGWSG